MFKGTLESPHFVVFLYFYLQTSSYRTPNQAQGGSVKSMSFLSLKRTKVNIDSAGLS